MRLGPLINAPACFSKHLAELFGELVVQPISLDFRYFAFIL
jgi:hypothetical protein